MSDKEWLEEIDKNKQYNLCGFTGDLLSIELTPEDYSYLYSQAERAQKLTKIDKAFIVSEKWRLEAVEQNKHYLFTINAMQQVLKDARHSLDAGEKVQGLEYGIGMADAVLEELQ